MAFVVKAITENAAQATHADPMGCDIPNALESRAHCSAKLGSKGEGIDV